MQLTITSKGQITLRQTILEHLKVPPGGKIDVDMTTDGRVTLSAPETTRSWSDIAGSLAQHTKVKATDEEIRRAAEVGWARRKGRSAQK